MSYNCYRWQGGLCILFDDGSNDDVTSVGRSVGLSLLPTVSHSCWVPKPGMPVLGSFGGLRQTAVIVKSCCQLVIQSSPPGLCFNSSSSLDLLFVLHLWSFMLTWPVEFFFSPWFWTNDSVVLIQLCVLQPVSVIVCAACYISHLQVAWMTEHFVSFGEKHQHDLHVAGGGWGLAPEHWVSAVPGGHQKERIRGLKLGLSWGETFNKKISLISKKVNMKFCVHKWTPNLKTFDDIHLKWQLKAKMGCLDF